MLPSRARTIATWLIPFALLAALSVLWALASPVFSVPDENAHVAKAVAQSHGEVIGRTDPDRPHLIVDLPEGYDYNHGVMCYIFHPEISADCPAEFGDGTGMRDFATWVGAYNPVYYAIVGWPSSILDQGVPAVYAMRIISALLSAALLAFAFQAGLARRASGWMPFGLAFLAMPMTVYLAGSVNPNGVEIAAGAALWVSLIRLLESYAPPGADRPLLPRWYLWAVVSIASAFLVNARAIGPAWLVVIIAACLLMAGRDAVRSLFADRVAYAWMGAIAAVSAFAIAWTLGTGNASGQASVDDAPFVGASPVLGTFVMLRRTGEWVHQAIGYFGWVDTTLPSAAYTIVYVVLGFLTLLALLAGGRRGFWTVLGVCLGAVLVPALIQGFQMGRTGLIWQGRYSIVLLVAIPIVSAVVLSSPGAGRLAFLARRAAWLGPVGVSVFGGFAFAYALRRYSVGLDSTWTAMFTRPEWQPPLGASALIAAHAIVSALFVAWLVRESLRAARPDPGAAHG